SARPDGAPAGSFGRTRPRAAPPTDPRAGHTPPSAPTGSRRPSRSPRPSAPRSPSPPRARGPCREGCGRRGSARGARGRGRAPRSLAPLGHHVEVLALPDVDSHRVDLVALIHQPPDRDGRVESSAVRQHRSNAHLASIVVVNARSSREGFTPSRPRTRIVLSP